MSLYQYAPELATLPKNGSLPLHGEVLDPLPQYKDFAETMVTNPVLHKSQD